MKKTLLFALLLMLPVLGFGQTMLTMTTLSSAITNAGSQYAVVASATGISAPTANSGNTYGAATSEAATYLYVDRELLQVKGVSGTTIQIIRGMAGTAGATHASGALVFIVPAGYFQGTGDRFNALPQGSCTRSNEVYLPRIQFATGIVSDCLGGQWVTGDGSQTQRQVNNLFRYPDPGGTAISALETAGTAAGAATEIYCTEIDLPYNMLITGLAVLNGTTVGTNKHFALLYDASGNVLANTATAGTTTAGASTYQKMALVTKYYAVGPARYFACDGLNGTTDTIRHAVTGTNDNVLGGTITSQTFGTAAAITAPSSFTTAKVPYFALY